MIIQYISMNEIQWEAAPAVCVCVGVCSEPQLTEGQRKLSQGR